MNIMQYLSSYLSLGIGGALLSSFLFILYLFNKKITNKKNSLDEIKIKEINYENITSENAEVLKALTGKIDIEKILIGLKREDRAKYIFELLDKEKEEQKNIQKRFYVLITFTIILFIALLIGIGGKIIDSNENNTNKEDDSLTIIDKETSIMPIENIVYKKTNEVKLNKKEYKITIFLAKDYKKGKILVDKKNPINYESKGIVKEITLFESNKLHRICWTNQIDTLLIREITITKNLTINYP